MLFRSYMSDFGAPADPEATKLAKHLRSALSLSSQNESEDGKDYAVVDPPQSRQESVPTPRQAVVKPSRFTVDRFRDIRIRWLVLAVIVVAVSVIALRRRVAFTEINIDNRAFWTTTENAPRTVAPPVILVWNDSQPREVAINPLQDTTPRNCDHKSASSGFQIPPQCLRCKECNGKFQVKIYPHPGRASANLFLYLKVDTR